LARRVLLAGRFLAKVVWTARRHSGDGLGYIRVVALAGCAHSVQSIILHGFVVAIASHFDLLPPSTPAGG
jgi:hypothetical protein